MAAETVIEAYFAAFNRDDTDAMLDLLANDIAHHVNQGEIRRGKDAFAAFSDHMTRCYSERLEEIVIFANGSRAAAEYIVSGTYLATDEGLPEANGQTYRLPAGSFFDVENGKITRVTTYYNLADWMAQVGA